MKQPLVTLLLGAALFPTFNTHAQNWCPPGATWVYGFQGGSTMLQYTGDTLLDGFVGQRIEQRGWMQLPWDPDSIVQTGGPGTITRTEPGLVLLWLPSPQEWDTLYWFSAAPGDRWSPGWHQAPWAIGDNCTDGAYVEVLDTSTTVVDGTPLRTLQLERYWNGEGVDGPLTIMERVGNTRDFLILYPPQICLPSDGYDESFACYGDNEVRYPESSTPCSLMLAVPEPAPINPESWSVSPVPFQGRFTVRSHLHRNASVSLLDMTGRVLTILPFTGDVLEVDAEQLAPGSYVVRLVDQRGVQAHRVVLKE